MASACNGRNESYPQYCCRTSDSDDIKSVYFVITEASGFLENGFCKFPLSHDTGPVPRNKPSPLLRFCGPLTREGQETRGLVEPNRCLS